MKTRPLQYYMHDGPSAFRFELSGELDGEGARRLDRDWRTASSTLDGRRLVVDITFLTGVDQAGRALLVAWHRAGAHFVTNSENARALAESVLGQPLSQLAADMHAEAASNRTWTAFRTFSVALLFFFMALAFATEISGATLRSETVDAWNDYLKTADAELQDRVRPGGTFLWTFEDAGRAATVQSGEIVVLPAPGQNPRKVPGGLIHHWISAIFLPNVRLDDVLRITNDYDRYKEIYFPSVVDSRTLARGPVNDKFAMLLMNKAFFLRVALETEYSVTNLHLDDRRFYSSSRTTHVQEVEAYGQPGEYHAAEGEGHGLLWKVAGVTRLQECEAGVYIELEAMALTRQIPSALRFAVDPIVRRTSRNSLLISLQQTAEAVRANSQGANRSIAVARK
jgi:ABC-type transporter Mla MlaB component